MTGYIYNFNIRQLKFWVQKIIDLSKEQTIGSSLSRIAAEKKKFKTHNQIEVHHTKEKNH